MDNKLVVFIDFDNTIANTRGNMLDILNQKYNRNYTLEDVYDTKFRGMYKFVTEDEPKKIYNTQEYFDRLDFMPGAYEVLEELKDKIIIEFVSVCSESGEKFKREWLAKKLPEGLEYNFTAVYRDRGETKGVLPMRGHIQIDDRMSDLFETDSSCKVCYKNFIDRQWNKHIFNTNTYEANTWSEIGGLIKFAIDHPEFAIEQEEDSLFDNENVVRFDPINMGDWS